MSVCTADDYYYYLNTAWHIAHGHGSSFDGGLTQHSGYQPLFLALLLVPFALGASKAFVVWYGLALQSTAALVAAYFAYRIVARTGNRWMALCPAAMLCLNLYFVKASLWGFETMLATACSLVVVDLALSGASGWILGLWLGLAGMARVDSIIMAPPLALFLAGQRRWRDVARTALAAALVCLPWVAWSTWSFGSPMPLSGAAKLLIGNPTGFWAGFETEAKHLPALVGGQGLSDRLPSAAAFALGVLILAGAAGRWRRLWWFLLYGALLFMAYARFTDTGLTAQFLRFVAPAGVVVAIAFWSRTPAPVRWTFVFPLALATLLLVVDLPFLRWVSGVPPLPNYHGICQREVPRILAEITDAGDRVGCFDAGAVGYFSDARVINLDGLVNCEIAPLLRDPDPAAGTWRERYLRYFAEKGITVLVGATGHSWARMFPELATWEQLHPPLATSDAGELVFLRVPSAPAFLTGPGVLDLTEELRGRTLIDGVLDPGQPACARLLGNGWLPPERKAEGGAYAWMGSARATATLPVSRPGAGTLAMRVFALNDGRGRRTLSVTVNGRTLGSQPLPAGAGDLEFAVPSGVLRAGDNALELRTERTVRPCDIDGSADRRPLGVLVDFLGFVPMMPAGARADDGARNDPYEDEEAVRLGAGRSIELQPARLLGTELRLAWDGREAEAGDHLAIEVVTAPGSPPLYSTRLAAAGTARSARVELASALPPKSFLILRLESGTGKIARGRVTLTSAGLVRKVRPHNVVLILVDTLRPDYLGCYGHLGNPTPSIDRLAKDGILFETAVSSAPITGPSHASLFTSRYPCETEVLNNCLTSPTGRLPLLAEMLADLGYSTAASISLSPVHSNFGFARGFDRFADDLGFSFVVSADTVLARGLRLSRDLEWPFFLWTHFAEPHEPYDAHGLVERTAEISIDGRPARTIPTSTFTPTALELDLGAGPTTVRIVSDDYFFVRDLALTGLGADPPTLTPAEPPLEPLLDFKATIGRGPGQRVRFDISLADQIIQERSVPERYAREIAYVDRQVGALLDSLRARGLYDDSLVIFASDHGEALGEFDLIGHIHLLYDCLLKVPLIIKPPYGAGFRPGTRRRDLAALVDLAPTVLGLLGRPPLIGARGRDLLAGEARRGNQDVVFSETHRPQAHHTLFSLRGPRYKIIHNADTGGWEFYDLKKDPQEARNLFDPGDRRHLAWRKRLEEQMTALKLGADAAAPPVPDERTRRALRTLGY